MLDHRVGGGDTVPGDAVQHLLVRASLLGRDVEGRAVLLDGTIDGVNGLLELAHGLTLGEVRQAECDQPVKHLTEVASGIASRAAHTVNGVRGLASRAGDLSESDPCEGRVVGVHAPLVGCVDQLLLVGRHQVEEVGDGLLAPVRLADHLSEALARRRRVLRMESTELFTESGEPIASFLGGGGHVDHAEGSDTSEVGQDVTRDTPAVRVHDLVDRVTELSHLIGGVDDVGECGVQGIGVNLALRDLAGQKLKSISGLTRCLDGGRSPVVQGASRYGDCSKTSRRAHRDALDLAKVPAQLADESGGGGGGGLQGSDRGGGLGDPRDHQKRTARDERQATADSGDRAASLEHRVGELTDLLYEVAEHINSTCDSRGEEPSHIDCGVFDLVAGDLQLGLGGLVPLRGLLLECVALSELIVAHLEAVRQDVAAGGQTEDRIGLTDARDAEVAQGRIDVLSGLVCLTDTDNERVDCATSIGLPCLAELAGGHACNTGESLEAFTAVVDCVAHLLHDHGHRGAASFSLDTDGRHRVRHTEDVTFGELGLLACTGQAHTHLNDVLLSAGTVVAQPDDRRAELVNVLLAGTHDVHELSE